ncbi:MAG: RNA 2',3'-cyclic phosphodiesterase, partial [Elusimicrobia bacterium]|nr:RNA 2',3'-cyclic phosphodiesterase [Elusimicrobiota bacterium]MBD3412023.1 RNA 2',3'-cyclic phosphodiesterase [Elusimicrobiota bacterium]
MRIFIAVRATDEIVHNMVGIQQSLTVPDMLVKWVEPYNLHVTLKFIGDVNEQTKTMVENIMQGLFQKTRPFSISFQGLGVFPNLQMPRVVWVGIGDGGDKLKELAEKLNDTLAMLNVHSEQWQFSGHLT